MKDSQLFTKILLWAYSRSGRGFTENELMIQFDLAPSINEQKWISDIFFVGVNNDRPLTTQLNTTRNEEATFALSDKGLALAVDHIELKEARDSSRRGVWIAIIAICISIFVGLYQIFIPQSVIVVEQHTEQ